jgi:hypothetical protein
MAANREHPNYLLKKQYRPKTFDDMIVDLKHFHSMAKRNNLMDSQDIARFYNLLGIVWDKLNPDISETNIELIRTAYKELLKQTQRYEDEKFIKKVDSLITGIEGTLKMYKDAKTKIVQNRVHAKAHNKGAANVRLVRNRGTLRNLHRKLNHSANHSNSNSSGSSSGSSSGRSRSKSKTRKANGNYSPSRSGSGASRQRTVTPKNSSNK